MAQAALVLESFAQELCLAFSKPDFRLEAGRRRHNCKAFLFQVGPITAFDLAVVVK